MGLYTDNYLKNCLLATITAVLVTEVAEFDHASQIWTLFKKRYTTLSQSQIFSLHSQLHECVLKDFTNIDAYLAKIKEMSGKLTLAHEPLSHSQLIHHTLKGLPSEYNTIKTLALTTQDTLTFEKLTSDLQEEEININKEAKAALQAQPSASLTAYPATSSNNASHNNHHNNNRNFNPRGRGGHSTGRGGKTNNNSHGGYNDGFHGGFNNMPFRGGRSNNFQRGGRFVRGRGGFHNQSRGPNYYNPSPTGVYCEICDMTNHHTNNCWFNTNRQNNFVNQQYHSQANIASSSGQAEYNSILDSGANIHIAGDMNYFNHHRPYYGPDSVQVGNGQYHEENFAPGPM